MIRYSCKLAVLLGFGLLLSGCAGVGDWMGSVWPPNGSGCSASLVVNDCRRMANLPEAEQRRQFRSLQDAFAASGGDRERLLLACMAVHPQSRYQNHARALKLLQGYRETKEPRQDLLALTDLLEELLAQKLQSEQQLAEERQRSESLASKLKALEDIEKIIQEREEKALPSP